MDRPATHILARSMEQVIHFLIRTSPAVRLAVVLSLLVHAAALSALLFVPTSRGQLSDSGSVGEVQTVLSIESPRTPPPAQPTPPQPAPSEPPPPEPTPPAPLPTPGPPPAPTPPPETAFTPQEQPSETKTAPVIASFPTSGSAPAAPPSATSPSSAGTIAPPTNNPISFAGMDSRRAERLVYVVDASGPMVSHWAWAAGQLRLSLRRLDDTQRFQVLISRLPPAPAGEPDAVRTSEVLSFSRDATLISATPASIADAVVWLSSQHLRGASDPLPGLARAIALKPDLILLLSHSFQQGLGANVGRTTESILAELDRLNPRGSNGRRSVVIKTIQLGSDDPTGLLQAIAREHGDGPGSYHAVTPVELEKIDGSK